MRILAGKLLNPIARHLRLHAHQVQTADEMEGLRKIAKDPALLARLEEMIEERLMDGSGLRAAGDHVNGDSWAFLQWLWDHREEILELVMLIIKLTA